MSVSHQTERESEKLIFGLALFVAMCSNAIRLSKYCLNLIFFGKTIFHFKQLNYQREVTKNDEVFLPDTELEVWEQDECFLYPCCTQCLAVCA